MRAAAARRYARALFALAREAGAVESVRRELAAMAGLLDENPEFAHALLRPLHPVAERRALMRAVCDCIAASETVRNFYCLLIDQRRLVDFPAIRTGYDRLADEAAGRTRAEVVSAAPLHAEQRERLRRALSRHSGQQVELSERVDPSLLGGAVATVGGVVFDGSLRTQLAQLHRTLSQGQ